MGGGKVDEEREAQRERRRHASRRFAVFSNDAGMYEIRGTVDPEVGALLMRAIEAASDALYDVAREEPLGPEPPEPEQRRADALGLLAERALAAGFGGGGSHEAASDEGAPGAEQQQQTGPAGPPSHAGTANERMRSDSEPSAGNGSSGKNDNTHFATSPNATSPTADLEDGTRLTPETARRLTCDAAVVAVTLDEEQKTVLGIGRRSRSIPSAIRRALRVRDGGCRFPGCGFRFIDGHHIHHWADGGPTNMDNVVSLCRFHHRAVHEDGFRVQRRGDGTFKFFSPEGWPLGRKRPCIDIDIDDPQVALVRQNRRRGVDPRWAHPLTFGRRSH